MDADKPNVVSPNLDLQRIALWFVIASVAAAALLGVSALLIGGFGDTQGRVLGTTFFVLAASLVTMATAPAVA